MEILAFLVVLFLVFWWGLGFFRKSDNQKYWRRCQQSPQPLPKDLGSQERDTTVSDRICPEAQQRNKTISVSDRSVKPRQQESLARIRARFRKHQLNIQNGKLIIQQLRSGATEIELPMAIALLRKINPYAFEELLLTCCKEQGWQIQPNFRYSGDGGVDGRVLIAGKLYALQAKRYKGYIKPEHIRDFDKVIKHEGAAGGFLIHTGKTGELSKELLRDSRITLISGQKLVNFVLGEKLRIVGITIPISAIGMADQ